MIDYLTQRIAKLTGASSVIRGERIQSVWSGYGELVRYSLVGTAHASVVVKHIQPAKDRGRSHDRKLRSYEIEQTWYSDWASRCGKGCRIAECIAVERVKSGWIFIFEDLDAVGFPRRYGSPSGKKLDACLRWLATFHGTFLGVKPRGLWEIGTYWNLKTRPDEHRTMARGDLHQAASAIDARLNSARYQTLVHGDAKAANFCFSTDGASVAAVDFQYVGGGCGVKDVAYLLAGTDHGSIERALNVYFSALRQVLSDKDGRAVETEWRALYPWAVADFQRFLAGWAPDWRARTHESAQVQLVLAELRKTP